MRQKKQIIYWLLPLLGTVFALWYVKNATADVVYSDYIRLVNSYLPDVWNPEKFFVPDILTRIPVSFLARIVNVELFGFSVTFERVLGVLSLGLAGAVLGMYCRERRVGCLWFALLMAVMFSLNKWEMLTNGSGWAHFFSFACFYYHELVLDRVWSGEEKQHDRMKLCALPWLIILGAAGPYCAGYAATLLLSYAFCMVRDHFRQGTGKWDRRYVVYGLCALLPLLLYMLSSSFAVEEHAGATGRSLGQILADHPDFPVRFLLKSFAGILVGGEELQELVKNGMIANRGVYLLGLLTASGYLAALWLNLRLKLYDRSIFPLMLLVSGGINHVLIFISRYIFEKEDYALSSRYALQFQVGILGIVLTFALAYGAVARGRRSWRALMALFCLAILAGNGYTTYHELKKAPYREESFERMARQAGDFSGLTDGELADLYEYRKGRDKIERAFEILKENHLNVFRDR
ncbi:MAG: hypothetical protein KH230_15515 [Enterocloster asparagiformis]|nr:hypothetical protein [Enterocloster asparagiformis]